MNLGNAASSDDDSNPDGLSEKSKIWCSQVPQVPWKWVGEWGLPNMGNLTKCGAAVG